MFINGFLGLLTSVSGGTATEMTAAAVPGYARAAIGFSTPRNGACVNATPFSFGVLGTPGPAGNSSSASIAGFGIYDAPTGGNLLLALAYDVARPLAGNGPTEQRDAGHLHLAFAALAGYPDGDAFIGTLAAQTVVGTWYPEPAYIAKPLPLSTGGALTITRGVLKAS